MRLDVPAGAAVRFEPGAGASHLWSPSAADARCLGLNRLTEGSASGRPGSRPGAARRGRDAGYLGASSLMGRDLRRAYAELFGPTTGDRSGSATPSCWAEVEQDLTRLRRRVRLRRRQDAARRRSAQNGGITAADGRARLRDHERADHRRRPGIVKADIGIKDGRIVGIGKAGNPTDHGRRHPACVIGANTDVRSARG